MILSNILLPTGLSKSISYQSQSGHLNIANRPMARKGSATPSDKPAVKFDRSFLIVLSGTVVFFIGCRVQKIVLPNRRWHWHFNGQRFFS